MKSKLHPDHCLVSIILPVFNGEEYLAQAIDSCLKQNYANFELIIIDDCSTDSSFQIAKRYSEKDNRIKIHQNSKNSKLPFTLNSGFELAKGKYLTWTSDDNILKPHFLSILVEQIEDSGVDFVYSDYDIIYHDDTFFKYQSVGIIQELYFQNVIGCSFLGKAPVFKENKHDLELFTIEDYAFWLITLPNFSCKPIRQSLYKYRMHGSSLTSQITDNGGFKKTLISKLYKKVQPKFDLKDRTIQFLVLNFLSKPMAAKQLLTQGYTIFNDIMRSQQELSNPSNEKQFTALSKHYQKLFDHLDFKNAIRLSLLLIQVYKINLENINWFITYMLKRIKRLLVNNQAK